MPLLEARALTKRYPGVVALDAVDFSLEAGEIHALLGENGAGKSTLVRALTGVLRPDSGEILLDGRTVAFAAPRDAQAAGIGAVHQEEGLVPALSVAENFLLGREPVRGFPRRVDRREARRRTTAALERLGLSLDPDLPLARFSIAVRQLVALARAIDVESRVLVLDEPTSSLDARETERLFALLRSLRDRGLAILFVTHFLEQVDAIADRVTVFRAGRRVATRPRAEFPRLSIVAAMLGREPEAAAARASSARRDAGAPFLRAEGIGRRRSLEPMDVAIRAGEVVGLAGLLGSGRTELVRLLYGLDRADSGRVEIEGRPVALRSPRDAIARGLGLTPEDRQREGIVPDLTIRENVVLALQAKRGIFRRLPRAAQDAIAARFVAELRIATPDAEKPAGQLSGGNQQKAILARWLAASPRLLALDEPTRGIDVGAKEEVMRLVARLAREDGLAILFVSAELEEVARASDRVVVLRDRKKVAEIDAREVAAGELLRLIAEPHA